MEVHLDEQMPLWIQEAWLINLNDQYRLFTRGWSVVLDAAKDARQTPEIWKRLTELQQMLGDRSAFRKALPSLQMPSAPEGKENLGYTCLPLFAMLSYVPSVIERLREHAVPQRVIDKTYGGFEAYIDAVKSGKRGQALKPIFTWLQLYLDGEIFSIGRLEFELKTAMGGDIAVFQEENGGVCLLAVSGRFNVNGYPEGTATQTQEGIFSAYYEQTEEAHIGCRISEDGRVLPGRVSLPKAKWKKICGPEDPVIGVHIPRGTPLTMESVLSAFDGIRCMLEKLYPETHYRAFYCESWLMDPQLKELLPSSANIVQFQNLFLPAPVASQGHDVYQFLFPGYEKLPEKLPERTTLERNVKQHLMSGGCIYEARGICPF